MAVEVSDEVMFSPNQQPAQNSPLFYSCLAYLCHLFYAHLDIGLMNRMCGVEHIAVSSLNTVDDFINKGKMAEQC